MTGEPRTFPGTFPGLASILRNGIYLVSAQWSEALLRAVYVIAIGRLLGPEIYGGWAFVMAFYMAILQATTFGTDFYLSTRLGVPSTDAGAWLGTASRVRLLAHGVGLLSGLAVALVWVGADLRLLALLVLPVVLFRGMALCWRAALIGFELSGTALRLNLTFRFLEVLVGGILLVSGVGILWLVILHGVSWLLEGAAIARAVRQRSTGSPWRRDGQIARELWSKGSFIGLSAAALGGLMAVPVLMAGFLGASAQELGLVGMASQVSLFAVMAVQAFTSASLPVYTRGLDRGDKRAGAFPYLFAMVALLFFAAAWVGAWLLGEPVLHFILGEQFVGVVPLLLALLLAGGAMALPGGAEQALQSAGRTRAVALVTCLALAFAVVLGVMWFESGGAMGLVHAAIGGWVVRAVALFALNLSGDKAQKPM